MTIQHKEGKKRGVFFMEDNDKTVAQLVYVVRNGDTMVIEHTEVNKELRGKNIGYDLVVKTVEHARQQGMKVSPVCPFAKAIFDKKPELGDVLV